MEKGIQITLMQREVKTEKAIVTRIKCSQVTTSGLEVSA